MSCFKSQHGRSARGAAARRVLMIAFHFPPVHGSSGLQRTLSFARYLPRHGWTPMVLTVSPRAYPEVRTDQMRDIADDLLVRRVFTLDTARHLNVGGRYPGLLALPDRWVSWCLGAIPAGLAMIARHRPAVLWSTYPIATAHLIGLALHGLTGLPWIADFRDSMTEDGYPPDPRTWRVFRGIERRAMERCAHAVFTAPKARDMYAQRYPQVPGSRLVVIENGFDEQAFAGLAGTPPPRAGRPLKLLHSGVIYPEERDPTAFFDAVARLRASRRLGPSDLGIVLRATGHDERYRGMLSARGIEDMVQLAPSLPYREALGEMMEADALLIMQARNCNHQIPAKLYEYLRARRPVLALTHPQGDTAAVLRAAGVGVIADLTDADDIARALLDLTGKLRGGTAAVAPDEAVAAASRAGRTRELADLLEGAVQR